MRAVSAPLWPPTAWRAGSTAATGMMFAGNVVVGGSVVVASVVAPFPRITYDEAAAILAELDHPRLKILFDCYHVWAEEGEVEDPFRRHAARIGQRSHQHVDDALAGFHVACGGRGRRAGVDQAALGGDLVDRGPDSRGVIEFILNGRQAGRELC